MPDPRTDREYGWCPSCGGRVQVGRDDDGALRYTRLLDPTGEIRAQARRIKELEAVLDRQRKAGFDTHE